MAAGTPQKKKGRSILRSLIADMGNRKRTFLFAIIVIFLARIALAIAPRVAGTITDWIKYFVDSGSFDFWLLARYCALLALLYLVGYGADGFVNRGLSYVSQEITKKLRIRTSEKLDRLSLKYLDGHPIGDTQSRVTTDLANLSEGIESVAPTLIGQVFLVVTIMIMMFITDWRLTLIYLITTSISLLGLRIIAAKTKKLFAENSRAIGALNAKVSDVYGNHTIVKAYGREEEKLREFDALNEDVERSFISSRFISGYMRPLSDLMARFSYIALCVVGAIFMIRGELLLGEFTAFLFYGNMIGTPLAEMSVAINNFQSALSSAERVYELLDEEEEDDEASKESFDVSAVKGEVRFENVAFSYVPEKELMNNVSFTAKPGQTMAIIGPSGAGKTTLINLLMRFYEINKGNIYIDGVPVCEMRRADLRKAFGMVLQDSWIFEGTIAENIAFGRPDATRKEIEEAAKLAGCDSFIEKLPNGYDTMISDERSALSAGEKQLLSIARAVIADPKILILDEATSQVDTKTEEAITRAMNKMMEGRTSFMIAHRLHTVKHADQIIYMVDGDIKEIGSHRDLIKKDGLYAAMYRSGLPLE